MSAVAAIRTVVAVLHTELPGPDRKRQPKDYRYRLAYRNANPDAEGCVMLWEVQGGRTPYQIAIERDDTGQVQAHCTCADAVFRNHLGDHICKHVRGFLKLAQPDAVRLEFPAYELSACA